MDKKQRLVFLGSPIKYSDKIKSIFRQSIVAYWPLTETSGTTARDISGNGRNGTYHANTVLANTLSPVYLPAPKLVTGNVNPYSASLAAIFNGQEFTIDGWAKATNAAT